MSFRKADITILGGGIVGLSVAVGLLQTGSRVTVLDGADGDFRASQGNFGLVWLQGKGSDFEAYAHWTRNAIEGWPDFAGSIRDRTGVDVALVQHGGFEFFTDASEFQSFAGDLRRQQACLGSRFSHEILAGDDVRRLMPGIGPDVVGASFCPLDGHVNPLRLLRALRRAVVALGGTITLDATVTRISPKPDGGFALGAVNGEQIETDRLVLCAGLGTAELADQLGFSTTVRPQRGELLITEKLDACLPFLSSTIRQVDEGGVQIGGTKSHAGLDDRDSLEMAVQLARHAVAVFPALADVRVVRSWAALRVMTPDGYPVYARSRQYPGAYLVTCHSGITLAPLHATVLADWINGTGIIPYLEAFDEDRFALRRAA